MTKIQRNMAMAIAAVIVLIVVGAIAVAASQSTQTDQTADDKMEKSEDVMEKSDDTMEKTEDDVMTKDEDKMEDDSAMKKVGSYIDYSASSLTDGDNVIFFAASWCPTCRALDNQINSNLDSIPSNLTILKADYDTEINLKQKHGVTYQHTLVQVDKDGNQINKWNGSQDISAIISNLT